MVAISGWGLSLIDVPSEPALVIWFCGCNLRCPYCHNWRVAESRSEVCKDIDLGEMHNILERYRLVVDWLQVTGGEPLLQVKALAEIFRAARKQGYSLSLGSNLTLPDRLQELLDVITPDHIATDIKYPPDLMIGLQGAEAWRAWGRFLESLEIINAYRVPWVELRILVAPAAGTPEEALGEALRKLKNVRKIAFRLVRLEQRNARNPKWRGFAYYT